MPVALTVVGCVLLGGGFTLTLATLAKGGLDRKTRYLYLGAMSAMITGGFILLVATFGQQFF